MFCLLNTNCFLRLLQFYFASLFFCVNQNVFINSNSFFLFSFKMRLCMYVWCVCLSTSVAFSFFLSLSKKKVHLPLDFLFLFQFLNFSLFNLFSLANYYLDRWKKKVFIFFFFFYFFLLKTLSDLHSLIDWTTNRDPRIDHLR